MSDGEGESVDSTREKVRNLSDSFADMRDLVRDIEKRVRNLETEEMHSIKKSLYQLESHVANFRAKNDDNKEKWQMALNFLVQLIWVIMASYVLTKLGIGMGPL